MDLMSVAWQTKAHWGPDSQRYLCQLCKLGVGEASPQHHCATAEEIAQQPSSVARIWVAAPWLPQGAALANLCLGWAAHCGPPAFSSTLCLARTHLVTLHELFRERLPKEHGAFSSLT